MPSSLIRTRYRAAIKASCLLLVSISSVGVAQDQEEAFGGAVVALPPFYVEPTNGERWTHASFPGFELLTTHDRTFARQFVRTFLQQSRVLEEFVPRRFLWQPYLPECFIVVDAKSKRSDPNEALSQTINSSKSSPKNRKDQRRFLPNLRLTGGDSSINFAFMDEADVDPNRARSGGTMIERITAAAREDGNTAAFRFSASRLSHQLNQRTPALPPWFIAGLVNLFDQCEFPADRIEFGPLRGLELDSPAATDESEPPALVYLDDLLGRPAPSDEAELGAWNKRAELLVRWSLFSAREANRDSLWSYLDRIPLESPDEVLFQSCFGLSYAEAESEIVRFHLEQTARRTIRLKSPGRNLPEMQIQTAERATVSRILGEWERLETKHVETNFPDLHTAYLARARKTIASARQNQNGSPELTAISGLLEYAAGNHADAKSELEHAVHEGSTRPLVLRTLARLKFDELGPDRPLASDTVTPAIELLLTAHRQSPAMADVYIDLAQVLEAAQMPLSRQHVGVLAAGIRAFPRNLPLVSELAILQTKRGKLKSAHLLIDYAQARAASQRGADTLAELATRLDSATATN